MSETKPIERGRTWHAGVVLLAGLLIAGPAWSGDEGSDKASNAKPAGARADAADITQVYTNRDLPESEQRRSRTYTNEDLERMFAPAAGGETAGEPAAPQAEPTGATPPPVRERPAPDPLEQLRAEQKAAAFRQQRVQQAEAELEAARARLENLQVQLLASVNPFSRRPQLSDEEQAYRLSSGESAKERRDRTQLQLDEARANVVKLEAQLAQLKRLP